MSNVDELYHYGKLGMHWGQHKYQNKYGALNKAGQLKTKQLSAEHKQLSNIKTLSPKGAKRLEEVTKQYEHLTGKSIGEHKTTSIAQPKQMSDMTNEELTVYNTRKQLETSYLNYQPKPTVSKGKQFAATVFNKIIAPQAIKAGNAYVGKYLANLMGDATAKAVTKDAVKVASAAKAAKDTTEAVIKTGIQVTK